MVCCAVATCFNHGGVAKEQGISFYKFPKDSDAKNRWIHACKIVDTVHIVHARICSQHFEDDDFERDLRAELLHLPPKKRLKRGVVPHLNMPGSSKSSKNVRLAGKAAKKEVERLLAEPGNSLVLIDGSVSEEQKRPQKFPENVNVVLLVKPVTKIQKHGGLTQDASDSSANEGTSQDTPAGSQDHSIDLIECKQEPEDTDMGQQLAEFGAVKRPRMEDFDNGEEQEILQNPEQVSVKMEKDQFDIFGELVAYKLRHLPSEFAQNTAEHLISQILSDASAGKYDQPPVGSSFML